MINTETVSIKKRYQIEFNILELNLMATVEHKIYIYNNILEQYNIIMDRDPFTEIGLNPCFSDQIIKWSHTEIKIPIQETNIMQNKLFLFNNPNDLLMDTKIIFRILDSKYTKPDLDQIVAGI